MRSVTAWTVLVLAVAAGRAVAQDSAGPAKPMRVAPLDPAQLDAVRAEMQAQAPAPPAAVEPAGGFGHRPRVAPLYPCPSCPPSQSPYNYPPLRPSPTTPPGTTPGTLPPTNPMNPMDPMTPPAPGQQPDQNNQQTQNPFAQGTEAGGEGAVAFNQSFFGDFSGIFVTQTVQTGVPATSGSLQRVVLTNGQRGLAPFNTPGNQSVQTIRVPLAGHYNGIQIVDNDQPRPVDRVYFSYNYYDQAGASLNGGQGFNLNRETIGFEKTFLDGAASFGMRLPFVQVNGPSVNNRQVGDLSLLVKYALFDDRKTGDLVSVGMMLTTPTGGNSTGVDGIVLAGDDIPHSWLFQPWAGFIKVYDRLYFQGISNLIVPTDSRDVTLWGNSLGAGYWLYRNPDGRYLTGIIPVGEIHVRTPLNHRDAADTIYVPDQVNVNAGVHFRMKRAIISGAVSVPTVGPRPWNIEAMGYINYLF